MLGKWEVVVKGQDVDGGEVTGDEKGAVLRRRSQEEGAGRESTRYLGSPPCRC